MTGRARAAVGALLFCALLALAVGAASAADGAEPADPETDVIGWEDGYWYNESIDVDQSDGLSDGELDALVARSMARVEHVRGLEFERTVPVELVSRESFRSGGGNRSPDPALRAFDNAKFEALFLIDEDTDSLDVQRENAGTSILGYYSPRRDAIVLVSENHSSLRVDEFTLAHELVHALQDQHFNLTNYQGATRDEVNAVNGLIEGDANLVQYRYRERCGVEWDCLDSPPRSGSSGSLANFGVYLVKYQPYSDGPAFLSHYRKRGGWDAVNAVYADAPASTEQVIHPPKYRDDPPENVTLEDRNTAAWERVRPPGRADYGELGEAALATMLFYPYYDSGQRTEIIPARSFFNVTGVSGLSRFDPLNYGHSYTAGWDGDRLHVYRNAENETAYVWRTVWDTPAEAAEFYDGYRQVLEYWGAREIAEDTYRIDDGGFADTFRVVVDNSTVTIVNAPTVAALPSVRQGSLPATSTPGTVVPASTETPPAMQPIHPPRVGSTTTTSETPTGTPTDSVETLRDVATPERTTTGRSTPTTTPIQGAGFGVAAAILAFLLVMARRAG